jgi:hypothetical protein
MDPDGEAERIRGIVLLQATCETVLRRLDADDIDDLALMVQIGELCETLTKELERFARRNADVGSTAQGRDSKIGEDFPDIGG